MNTTATFSGHLHTAEASTALWQWDYGQKLFIRGINLPAVYEVHFCNAGDEYTMLQIGDTNGVRIPNECLQTGKHIYAYIYLHEGSNDGETVYKVTIKVNPRAEPGDRIPDEKQKSKLDEAIEAVNAYFAAGGGSGGSRNYATLINKPMINGVFVNGEQTGEDLGLVDAEEGKGLSENNYDDISKQLVDLLRSLCDTDNNGKMIGIQNGRFAALSIPVWSGGSF